MRGLRWMSLVVAGLLVSACSDDAMLSGPESDGAPAIAASQSGHVAGMTGVVTANGWYEEEEIYYILGGIEEGVTERGPNQIYFIGNDRLLQANVVLHISGEPGYSPHWNVNLVHTAPGVTVQDIIDAGLASDHFNTENVLFDDAEDILAAEYMGLVTIVRPGVVVQCPIISEEGAEAPGNQELPDDFPPIPTNATF